MMLEQRPTPGSIPASGENFVTFNYRGRKLRLLCPYHDPRKVASWLMAWRDDPLVRKAEMRSRLDRAEREMRKDRDRAR
jgi:hypothetical protein